MTIDKSIELFVNYISNERRLSAGTVEKYSHDLRRFQSFLDEQEVLELDDMTARNIRDWQMDLMQTNCGPRSTNRALSALRSWCRYLRKQGYYHADPFQKISSVKTDKKLPVFYKEGEVERIYEADLFPDTFDGERDKLLLRILYETGIRRAEAVGLTEGSVDIDGLTIKVLGKRNKERIIPIENELAQNIQRFIALKKEKGLMMQALLPNEKGSPLTASMVYSIVRKYMTSISSADKISPHVFRHTFATHMLNEGANIDAIKELLGHTDLMATEVYTHVTREHLKEAYKHAHPRANKKT